MPDTYAVVGSTSGVGIHIARKLLERGHMVRALVRNADKARDVFGGPSGLELIDGDITDQDAVHQVVVGAHYVISSVGAVFPDDDPEEVDYRGVRKLVDAAAAQGHVAHFVLVSSIGVTHDDHPLNARFKNILHWKLHGENHLRSSGLPYTIVRPGELQDGPGNTKAVKVAQGDTIHGAISRETLSEVCLGAIGVTDTHDVTFEVVEADSGPPPSGWAGIFAGLKVDGA